MAAPVGISVGRDQDGLKTSTYEMITEMVF